MSIVPCLGRSKEPTQVPGLAKHFVQATCLQSGDLSSLDQTQTVGPPLDGGSPLLIQYICT
jgi:hypothetical protein